MVNLAELRIKNLLETQNEESEIFVVDAIDSIEQTVSGNGMENVSIEDLSPIPLTHEWLERMGFLNDSLLESHTGNKSFTLQVVGKEFRSISVGLIGNEIEFYNGIFSQNIKFVHQLQNLFFALVGKELEVKP